MSTPQSSVRRRSYAAVLLALLAGSAASAQTSVWTGTTGSWSTAGNWSPASVPLSGASTVLEFGHTGTAYVATDDIAGDFQLNVLRFTGSTGGNISLLRSASQSLVFVANGGTLPEIQFNSTSSGANTISAPMVLNANTTITSSISNATNNLQLGAMSGTGALIVDYTTSGSGAVLLAVASTHSGGVDLRNGRVVVGNAGAFGSGALTISGGILRTTNSATNLTFANTLNIGGNFQVFEVANTNPLTFANGGAITGTNVTRAITLGNTAANALTLGGAFSGSGNGLSFLGTGTVNLGSGAADAAANTYNGTTTVSGSGVALNLNKAAGTNALAGNLAVSGGTVGWNRSNQIADTASVSQSAGAVTLGLGLSETVAASTLTGGTFTVAKDAVYSTGSLTTTTLGSRFVGGTLAVGSGGLVINHDGTASNRNAFTLYEAANTASGVLLLNGNLTFNNATAAGTKVQITRSSGTGYIDLGGGTRTFTINDGGAVDDLEITVKVTNGGLVKEGAGVLAFANTLSDYTGATTINGGTIRANSTTVLSNQSTYTLANTAGVTLDLNGNSHTIGGLSGGGSTGGTVALGAATLTVGNNNANTTYTGAITGAGGLTKIGTGSLTLASGLAYTGATLVSNGTLVVNGSLASSGVTVNGADAVLGGSGAVNSLTITQGTFGPGNSPGTFTSQGSVSFGAAATFAVEAASAASYDRLVVNGAASTITIDAAAALFLSGFDALSAQAAGTEFILIENNSSNSIVGTFAGYEEGHSFTLGANTFFTSYQIGGNDFGFVVTSAIPEPSTVAVFAGLSGLAAALVLRRRRSVR
jgi:autotransporter-associated beta strand protein